MTKFYQKKRSNFASPQARSSWIRSAGLQIVMWVETCADYYAAAAMNKQSNPNGLSFPLEVGKRWRFATDWLFKPKGSRGSMVVEVEVVTHERVAVPAGEFEAFKLVSKGALSATSPINSQYVGVITTTYWYAPAARAIVKSVTHSPYLGVSAVEMVAYQLRP